MHELLGLTLVELADRLRAGRASPVELMDAVLQRIDATHADLNAVVARRDRDALPGAMPAPPTQRIAGGTARPLEGMPLGVKDLEDAAGLVTSQGSLPFRDHVAAHRLHPGGAVAGRRRHRRRQDQRARVRRTRHCTKNRRVRRHALAVEPRR